MAAEKGRTRGLLAKAHLLESYMASDALRMFRNVHQRWTPGSTPLQLATVMKDDRTP